MQTNEAVKAQETGGGKVSSLFDCSIASADSTLIHGDCLDALDKLAKDGITVDVIVTDPPFFYASGTLSEPVRMVKKLV